MKKLSISLFLSIVFIALSHAQIVVNTSMSDNDLVQTLAGPGVAISNVAVTAAPGSYGRFTQGNVGQGNIGISNGILLTSGSASEAVGPNNSTSQYTINGFPGNALLDALGQGTTHDATVIEFDINTTGTMLAFNYVFGSEEYHEFVNNDYNDVFAFFISGPGISGIQNMALLPNINIPVSIHNVNNGDTFFCQSTGPGVNTQFFVDNCGGASVEYDAFTTVLQARRTGLTPCATYHVIMAIADVQDSSWDSGVFISSGGYNTPGGTGFTVAINCNGGNWSVTATASDPTVTNHRWELWATDVPGATSGGTLVGTINGGLNATFNWLDLSKHYYIRHVSTVCGVETESVVEVPDFGVTANAAFTLEDVNGTEKDVFCFGEDVYLDGTASYNYDRYYINCTRRPAGSGPNVPFGPYALYNWTLSNSIGVFNLSQAFANHQLPGFEPGFEYEIHLAIANLQTCVPWVETKRRFTVVCCDVNLDTNFKEQLVDHGGGDGWFSLNAIDFEPYGSNTTHEWLIYSSYSWNSGPYTLEGQTTTVGPGPVEIFDQGTYGRYYFVIHKLSNACGEDCFGQFVEGTILDFPFPGLGLECELCGPLDCSIIDNICLPPVNEKAFCTGIQLTTVAFTWNPVQNATQYILELNYNDPSCCTNTGLPGGNTFTTSNTAIYLSGHDRRCFSWRVGAVCGDQTMWTTYHCFRGCSVEGSDPQIGLSDSDHSGPAHALGTNPVRIYPNPANEEINIRIADESSVELIKITDLQGKTVFEQSRPDQHLKIDSSKIIAGMYAVRIIYPDGSQVVKNVVITH